MAQQLVMTPQLQQAIKLLQLSHLEMAEVLREEMEQNPLLEDRGEGAEDVGSEDADFEPVTAADEAGSAGEGGGEASEAGGVEVDMASDLTSASDAPVDATPEPNSADVDRDTDWENYLDSYSYALPATAGGAGGDELPPFEATLSKSTSLLEHLCWQVQMVGLTPTEVRIAALLIEEINDDGYLAG
ncbi:MAG TPA: hypothetical protein VFH51_02080, partial [Myxococcota bacterium]|nr:hypothetical protein [Myxococcota bacterium]